MRTYHDFLFNRKSKKGNETPEPTVPNRSTLFAFGVILALGAIFWLFGRVSSYTSGKDERRAERAVKAYYKHDGQKVISLKKVSEKIVPIGEHEHDITMKLNAYKAARETLETFRAVSDDQVHELCVEMIAAQDRLDKELIDTSLVLTSSIIRKVVEDGLTSSVGDFRKEVEEEIFIIEQYEELHALPEGKEFIFRVTLKDGKKELVRAVRKLDEKAFAVEVVLLALGE